MEDILADLPRHGTLIKDRAYRQVWRFEWNGKPYYLKFYPRDRAVRRWRGNPAMREFHRLQWLQKAAIPSPRVASAMIGFRLDGHKGDAVVIEGIEPSVPLDQYLGERQLRAETIPDRAGLARQVTELVAKLGRAGLGHNDLHLGNFLLHEGKIYLLDGYAVRKGGLRLADVAYLGGSAERFATRSDLWRGWLALGNGGPMPKRSALTKRYWRKFAQSSLKENDWFGRIKTGGWSGHYFKCAKSPRRWAEASGLRVRRQDWELAWPRLWEQIESGKLEALKRSPSGDVLAGEIELAGRTIAVVVKRPYKRYWYRYVNEIGRGSRARRAWIKAWRVIVRNIPTAWPLLVLEKRTLGYVTDSILVLERVAGPTLASVQFDAMDEPSRRMLLHRTGAILRRIDATGLAHFDAKASNWIVSKDPVLGERPILVDVDGIRSRKWIALGINRLLRSLRQHPQYTPRDSLALCQGYAPYSPAPGKASASMIGK